MRIYCLVPVHNRLDSTRKCVQHLLAQDTREDLVVVVIDDGSSDGTAEFLRQVEAENRSGSRRVTFCTGTGEWWWSRCINEGIELIACDLEREDGVLFMNDDVVLDPDYLSHLLETWSVKGPSVVMSQLVDLDEPGCIIASPIRVDPKRLEIRAIEVGGSNLKFWSPSDVAPGRGTLYPAGVFIQGLRIDAERLPHYLADYEFSVRASRLGYPIFVAHRAEVKTKRDWGNSRRKGGLRWRMFAAESPDLLTAYWRFWRVVSPQTARFVLGIRLLRYQLLPSVAGIVCKKRFV